MNSRFAKVHKKAQKQKWQKISTMLKKKIKFQLLFSTQKPPDDWPDALYHVEIGLTANKYTKF